MKHKDGKHVPSDVYKDNWDKIFGRSNRVEFKPSTEVGDYSLFDYNVEKREIEALRDCHVTVNGYRTTLKKGEKITLQEKYGRNS